MGVLSRLLNPKADTFRNPPDWFKEFVGGGKTASGMQINEISAWNISAVYACIRIISETVGSLSLITYKQDGDKKTRATDHPIYSLLHDSPNSEMTAMVFRETLQANLLSWGNAYAEIQRNGIGRAVALWPILSSKVIPERVDNRLLYRVKNDNGTERYLDPYQILHIPGLGFDGISGQSPIRLARESLGLTAAAEEFGASFFGNGAHVGGVLEHPGRLNPDTIKLLRKSWEEIHQGSDNAHKVAILEEGMKWSQTTIPPNDAQFLETRKFQVEDIARWYNVPPHKIKHLERSTFNNIEHQSIEFVQDTIRPWLVRWEQEIKRKLFMKNEKSYYSEFLIDSLLRGDSKSRNESYMTAITGGWLSRNEVRKFENLNPIEGLDDYLVPLNMGVQGEQKDEPVQQTETNDREKQMTVSVADRLSRKEIAFAEKTAMSNLSYNKYAEKMRDFYNKLSDTLAEALVIDKNKAQRYTHNSCEALIAFYNNNDLAGFNNWRDNRFNAIKNLPYDDKSQDTQIFVNIVQAAQEVAPINIDARHDAPIINLPETVVNVASPTIEIKNETPIVNVEVTNEVQTPQVNITNEVETPIVNVEVTNEIKESDRQITFSRDSDGNIIEANINDG